MRHPIAWPGQHRTTWPDFPRIFPIRNGLFCELSATFFGLVTFEKTSPSSTEASYPEPSDFTARRCMAASRAHRPHRRPAQHVRGRSGYDLSICTQRTSRKERLLFDLSYNQNMSKSLKVQILSMLLLFLEWDEAPEVTRAEKDDKAQGQRWNTACVVCFFDSGVWKFQTEHSWTFGIYNLNTINNHDDVTTRSCLTVTCILRPHLKRTNW